MVEEGRISMTEFNTVVENFRSDIRKVVEVVNHRFDRVDGRMDGLEGRMGKMEGNMFVMEGHMDKMEGNICSMKEQIGLLHEGQTEIKAELKSELKNKVSYAEFEKLEKRVVRLETKVA